jgi:hypothetical protein
MRSVPRNVLVASTVLALGLVTPKLADAAAAARFIPTGGRTVILRASTTVLRGSCGGRPQLGGRGGPICVPSGRHDDASSRRRATPIAHRRFASGAQALGLRYDDGGGRRRTPDAHAILRTRSADERWRVQRLSARLDRRLTAPGAMFHEAHAPPRPSRTDLGGSL